jgi:hypothetical protein
MGIFKKSIYFSITNAHSLQAAPVQPVDWLSTAWGGSGSVAVGSQINQKIYCGFDGAKISENKQESIELSLYKKHMFFLISKI